MDPPLVRFSFLQQGIVITLRPHFLTITIIIFHPHGGDGGGARATDILFDFGHHVGFQSAIVNFSKGIGIEF